MLRAGQVSAWVRAEQQQGGQIAAWCIALSITGSRAQRAQLVWSAITAATALLLEDCAGCWKGEDSVSSLLDCVIVICAAVDFGVWPLQHLSACTLHL